MTCGEKISRLRKTREMTQSDLGKVLNVTYQAVSKWERGESLPDFNMMSQIATLFQVPLSYFEDGGENGQLFPAENGKAKPAPVASDIVGMCTECGKMLNEKEIYSTTPKIICKECAERKRGEQLKKEQAYQATVRYNAERTAKEQIGGGFDAKLAICFMLALAGYIVFTVLCFINPDDRELLAALMLLVPVAVFALPFSIFEFIDDLKDKDDGADGYSRNLSLIVGAVFAAVNIIFYLVLYLNFDKSGYYLGLLGIGAVVSFTFISQYMWGSVICDIFTCGGFTFKLPGVIFSLTPESIIMMIIIKLVLGIVSILVFIVTTVFFAVVAIFGSVLTFIPCVLSKSVKDRQAKEELKKVKAMSN